MLETRRGQATEDVQGEQLSADSMGRYQQQVDDFLRSGDLCLPSAKNKKGSRRKLQSLKEVYQANKLRLLAFDVTIRKSFHWPGLVALMPTRRCKRLQSGVERYFVDRDAMPEDVRSDLLPGDRTRRSWLKDNTSGEVQLECICNEEDV